MTALKCSVCADVEAGHYAKHAPDMHTYPDAPLTTTRFAGGLVCQPHVDLLEALAFLGNDVPGFGRVLADPNRMLSRKPEGG